MTQKFPELFKHALTIKNFQTEKKLKLDLVRPSQTSVLVWFLGHTISDAYLKVRKYAFLKILYLNLRTVIRHDLIS